MRYRYHICDVFTDRPFGGNPLAVLPDARGLDTGQMQRIAREFNFSETTFVLPPESGHTRRVRIFTPNREVPFAGHPNVGTAFVLASTGELGALDGPREVVFEEAAGPVPVSIRPGDDGVIRCELTAPAPLALGEPLSVEAVAAAVSLRADDVVTDVHAPIESSVGLPFLVTQLRDLEALGRAEADVAAMRTLESSDGRASMLLYCRTAGGGDTDAGSAGNADIRARMFAPLSGVPEDPATGSAHCALAGLLADCEPAAEGDFAWRIDQGVEMGRPSRLDASAVKRDGRVEVVRIGGASVLFAEGFLEAPA